MTTVAACLLATTPAAAQPVLRDAETEALLRDMSAPLVRAAGLTRKMSISCWSMISVNAFVAGGQAVYIHSGLINEASSALEVQGVIAHELGHVVGGHAIDDRGAKMAGNISILFLLLLRQRRRRRGGDGRVHGRATGRDGQILPYTRGEEEAADAAGASFLSKAGMSGRGSLEFFTSCW
jgi:predicted Zn-dependent protease